MARKSKLQLEIEAKIKVYHELKKQQKEIDKEIKEARTEIIKFLKDKGLYELVADEYIAQVKYTESSNFDSKNFKIDYPSLYNQYLKPVSKTNFDVLEKI